MSKETHLLAGDIGGTKTALGIYSAAAGPREPLVEKVYRSLDFPDLESVVRRFLEETGSRAEAAAFGIAGPVVAGRAIATNLPWSMSEEGLRESLRVKRVVLLNDLEATACAVPSLRSDELETLLRGKPEPHGSIAVIAPGTGLGEAFLFWGGDRFHPHPSEGGHTDFAPSGRLESDLRDYLADKLGHVSYERVCSGTGLPNIYDFLRDRGYAEEPEWLAERLAAVADCTPVIVEAARDASRPCELCRKTVEIFVAALGAQAGNLALTVFATGGVYVAGGMVPHLLPWLRQPLFTEAILSKGRMQESVLISQLAVHLVVRPDVALTGLAWRGLQEIE